MSTYRSEGGQPLLTVAMPVFNGGRFLRLALLSIIHQSFSDWELILIDDGSNDHAVEGVADIVDPRIRIIRDGENKGLAARLNEAIDLASGKYFARMDQDDISHPERFSKQLALLQGDQSLDLVGAKCVTISENNHIVGFLPGPVTHKEICLKPWLGFYLPHPTWLGRTAWFRQYRYMLPGPYCCEDQELLLRTHQCSRFHVLPEYLLAYRLRDRFDFAKAWRTRKTLFGIQSRYFRNKKEYWSAGLAQVGFCLRLAKDIWTLIIQSSTVFLGKTSRRVVISDPNTEEWCEIIEKFDFVENDNSICGGKVA